MWWVCSVADGMPDREFRRDSEKLVSDSFGQIQLNILDLLIILFYFGVPERSEIPVLGTAEPGGDVFEHEVG